MSAFDLAAQGHLTRNQEEDLDFLVASGVSEELAAQRLGIDRLEQWRELRAKRARRRR